jgi:hypothetical protein
MICVMGLWMSFKCEEVLVLTTSGWRCLLFPAWYFKKVCCENGHSTIAAQAAEAPRYLCAIVHLSNRAPLPCLKVPPEVIQEPQPAKLPGCSH